MANIQYKGFSDSLKDLDTKNRIVTGYFSKFGNIDSDNDIIEKGAFKKTIMESGPDGKNRIMHLWQHDVWQPIAKPEVLKEDNEGLYFESKFPDTTLAKDVLELYANGIVNEHSIGFIVINSDRQDKANVIKEIKLWEGSTVTWGANSETPFTGFKSMSKDQKLERLNERIGKLEKFLHAGSVTDEMFYKLDIEFKHLKDLINSLAEPTEFTQPEPNYEELKQEFLKNLK